MVEMRFNFEPEGSHDSKIAVVCEKPDRDEVAYGRLLAGKSGERVRAHMKKVGFDAGKAGSLDINGQKSQNVWLTNAVQSFDEYGNPSIQDIIHEQPRLLAELASLPNLNVIIAMGNAALASLTNFHCVKQIRRKGKLELAGIMSWRGSRVLSVFGTKIVPTPHPSFYMHGEWRYEPIVSFDVARAAKESNSRSLVRPKRVYFIEPSSVREVIGWLDFVENERNGPAFESGPCIAYDIETRRGVYSLPYTSCIALSPRPDVAYCIPFTRGRAHYWSASDELEIRLRLARLFARRDRCFIAQNGTAFDNWVIRREGIVIPTWHLGFDTMLAHRRLAPDLPHSLDFLTSIYTDEPYYKDESGRGENFGRVPDRQFWVYNCKDAACTLESAIGIRADLAETGQLKQFYNDDMSRVQVCSFKIEKGFKVDKIALKKKVGDLNGEIEIRNENLRNELGFVPKTKSYLDMGRVLDKYAVVYERTAEERPAISEENLLIYAHRNPRVQHVLQNCIDVRQRETLKSNFLDLRTDVNGFYHAIFDPCKTKSGRDASQSAHEGGPQMLNIPENLRHIFIPDRPNLVLTTADLKQAEAMYVAWDAQDPFLIRAFESGLDVHRIRGCVIFHNWKIDYHRSVKDMLPPEDLIAQVPEVCKNCSALGEIKCNHSERFISKQSGLAFQFDMGPRKYVTKILPPFGVFLTEAEGKRHKEAIVTPAMKAWQNGISDKLKRSRWLSNSLGRKREFFGLHDQDMDREAFAWVTSSTITDIIAPAERGLHELFIRDRYFRDCRVVQQWYDAITVCHPPAMTEEIISIMTKMMKKEIWLHGRKLIIPAEFKTGNNWAFKKSVS